MPINRWHSGTNRNCLLARRALTGTTYSQKGTNWLVPISQKPNLFTALLRWTRPNAGTTAGARRTVLRPPRRPSWRFAARVTVAMLQAGMLFQFGFDCCLVRYLLAALLERDGFVLVLRSRESFCVSLLWPHTCCVCRVRVHPGHRAGRICTCSTLQWSKHILGRPGSAPHGARGERNRGTT